jgi:hypothetical protein
MARCGCRGVLVQRRRRRAETTQDVAPSVNVSMPALVFATEPRRPDKAENGIFRLQRILFECHQVADSPLYCQHVRAYCSEGMRGRDEASP